MPSHSPYPSAALFGLYEEPRHLTYKSLTRDDMKILVRVLRGFPFPPAPEADLRYVKLTEKAIHDLPNYLRASKSHRHDTIDKNTGRVKEGMLCSTHSGMNAMPIYSTWDWVRHELNGSIGSHIYPVIMHGGLTKHQELAARQLEPVLQLYRTDFSVEGATPPRHKPIVPKMGYNDRSACILARIGSDAAVVTALLAGIVTRTSSRGIGTRNNIKSNRVRFLQYWLKAFDYGERLINEAWDLGEEMKRLRRAWEDHVRYLQRSTATTLTIPNSGERDIGADVLPGVNPGLGIANSKPPAASCSWRDSEEVIVIGFDISDPFWPHSMLQPTVQPFEKGQKPAIGAGTSDLLPLAHSIRTVPRGQANVINTSARPIHPEQAGYYAASSNSSLSIVSSNTDNSWNSIPSYSSASSYSSTFHPPTLRPYNTSREALRKAQLLPKPSRASIYGEFGPPFIGEVRYADISPPGTPKVDAGIGAGNENDEYEISPQNTSGMRPMTQVTRWGDLY